MKIPARRCKAALLILLLVGLSLTIYAHRAVTTARIENPNLTLRAALAVALGGDKPLPAKTNNRTNETAAAAPAQSNFSILQSVLAGGGGTSAGGNLALDGTIGQALAGASSGGQFSLLGGFQTGDNAQCQSLTINPAALPAGQASQLYNQPLSQTGGTGAITWNIISGAPPNNITLNSAGVLSGTPVVSGLFTFTVQATDANNCTGTRDYSLLIFRKQKVIAGNNAAGVAGDEFGVSVAISGNTAVVGAFARDVGGKAHQGSAYVFEHEAAGWAQKAFLTANDGAMGDNFGSSVAISGDTIIVGAPFAEITTSGSTAFDQGAVYVFARESGTWTQKAKLTSADGRQSDKFGFAVALSSDSAVIGAKGHRVGANLDQGSAYIFVRQNNAWTQQAELTAGDGAAEDDFGSAVAINGDLAIVGALHGDVVANQAGHPNQGSAYVFSRAGANWAQEGKLVADNGAAEDNFGTSVAISGDTAFAGAPLKTIGGQVQQGAVYVFTRSNPNDPVNKWVQSQRLLSTDGIQRDQFGISIALSGDKAIIGARTVNFDVNSKPGAGYVFARGNSIWSERSKLVASDGAQKDEFGFSVALSGDKIIVGAYRQDVGGNANQGAAYLFDIGAGLACQTITITPLTLPNGQLGQSYSQSLSQTGGTGTITWSTSQANLPGNMTLNPATGLLSGAPTASGTFNFTATATDANGCMGSRAYSLVIGCPAITITPGSLPAGMVAMPFSQQLTATGGAPPYSFSFNTGSIPPPGLNLSATGILSGTPSVADNFPFSIKVMDAGGCIGTQPFTLTINPAIISNGLQFYPLAKPLRLLDTRPANQRPGAAFDLPGVKLAGGSSGGTDRVEQARVTFDGQTIPASAKAVVGTATVINFPGAGEYDGTGNVTFYPSDANRPEVSNLNYAANQTVSNGFTVALGNTGAFSIFSYSDVHLVVEIVGYYAAPTAAGLYFHPLPQPIRLLETRVGYTGCDAPRAPLTGGSVRTEQGRLTCGGLTIPAAAQALVGNLTAVNATVNGSATAYAGDLTSTPIATSLAYVTTQPIANAFVTRLGSDGSFKLAVSQTTDFLVDISGYYSPEATDVNGQGLLFTQLAHPIRLLETRAGYLGCNATSAPLAARSYTPLQAWGSCDGVTIPTSAKAIIGNVTAVTTTPVTVITMGSGNVTLYPSAANQPDVSNLNYTVNQNIPNAFTVGLSNDGKFTIFVFDTIDLLIDVSGYFAP